VLARLDRDVSKSIGGLVQAFCEISPAIRRKSSLTKEITKPTTEQLRTTCAVNSSRLSQKAKDLADEMKVTTVVKDITWATLNDPGFVDWLRKQWPQRMDLEQPFRAYRAARERMK